MVWSLNAMSPGRGVGDGRDLPGIGVLLIGDFIESDDRIMCYKLPRSMIMHKSESPG